MSQRHGINPMIAFGFTALGVGYLYEAMRSRQPAASVNGLGYAGGGERNPEGIRTLQQHPVRNIDERVGFIVEQIRKDSEDKDVISEARAIVSGKCPVERGGRIDWCVQPKAWKDEIAMLFHAVTDPNSAMALRYTRDHATIDLFGSSALMRRLPAEDCDGMSIRLGALLRSIGYAVRCRIVAPAGQPRQWAHIYLMVGSEPGTPSPARWYALDPTEPQHGPFWEVPSSLISTKKDYEV